MFCKLSLIEAHWRNKIYNYVAMMSVKKKREKKHAFFKCICTILYTMFCNIQEVYKILATFFTPKT